MVIVIVALVVCEISDILERYGPHLGFLAAIFVVIGDIEITITTPSTTPAVLAEPCTILGRLCDLVIVPPNDRTPLEGIECPKEY